MISYFASAHAHITSSISSFLVRRSVRSFRSLLFARAPGLKLAHLTISSCPQRTLCTVNEMTREMVRNFGGLSFLRFFSFFFSRSVEKERKLASVVNSRSLPSKKFKLEQDSNLSPLPVQYSTNLSYQVNSELVTLSSYLSRSSDI